MENNYAEETQFLSDKAAGKSRFRELSTEETKVKGKCHTNSDKKNRKREMETVVRVSEVLLTNLKKLTNTYFFHTSR